MRNSSVVLAAWLCLSFSTSAMAAAQVQRGPDGKVTAVETSASQQGREQAGANAQTETAKADTANPRRPAGIPSIIVSPTGTPLDRHCTLGTPEPGPIPNSITNSCSYYPTAPGSSISFICSCTEGVSLLSLTTTGLAGSVERSGFDWFATSACPTVAMNGTNWALIQCYQTGNLSAPNPVTATIGCACD